MKKALLFTFMVLCAAGLAFGGTITISQPAGGSFAMGAACPVHWTASGVGVNVKIQLIRPGGGLVGLLVGRLAPDSSPYPWVVAAPAEAGQTYRVRVSAVDGSCSDESAEFSVTAAGDPGDPGTPGAISAVRLGGASPFTIGNSVTVSWTASGVSQNLKLQLLNGGGGLVGAIVNSLAAGTTSHSWTAGQYIGGMAGAGNYKIRVSTVDNALTAESPAFVLAAAAIPGTPGTITVTEPNAGSSWRPGSRQTIAWTRSADMPHMVQITLRREGAPETEDPVVRIADGCANNGSRVWFIPDDLAAGRYFVRVRASSALRGDSAAFAIDAEGARSGPAGPETPIRADLEMPGVGVEYYDGNIVAWVKNNGPDSVRDHDVKFLLDFPERGGGGHYITRRITVAVGAEKGIPLQPLAAADIPDAGLRAAVSIETSRSNISDANRLNQHRDVRLCALDLRCDLDSLQLSKVYSYIYRNLPFKVKFSIHVRHNLPRAVSNIRVKYEVRGPDGPLTGSGAHGSFTIASLASGATWTKDNEIRFGDAGEADDWEPKIRPGTTYRIIASIDDPGNAFCDTAPGNDTAALTFRFPD